MYIPVRWETYLLKSPYFLMSCFLFNTITFVFNLVNNLPLHFKIWDMVHNSPPFRFTHREDEPHTAVSCWVLSAQWEVSRAVNQGHITRNRFINTMGKGWGWGNIQLILLCFTVEINMQSLLIHTANYVETTCDERNSGPEVKGHWTYEVSFGVSN